MNYKMLMAIFLTTMFIVAPSLHATSTGEQLPNFKVTTLDGTMMESEKIVGKSPLFLVFWATWCPNCKREIPHINQLVEEFGSKGGKGRGMEFLGVNVGVNDSEKKVRRYAKKYAMDYPIYFDKDSSLTKRFKVSGTPTIIIVDKSGIVRYRDVSPPEDLENHLEDLSK